MILKKVDKDLTGKFQTNNSLVRNSLSSPKTRHDVQLSKSKGVRVRLGPSGAKSAIKVKETATSPDFAQEHQVAKRQKLECGNSGEESSTSPIQRKAKLSFTRPKGPQFEFSRRGHSVRVKSFVEIEEDMMANIPKFKARPVNKKILQSKGDLGLFSKPKREVTRPQEFHFATDERIPPEKSVIDLFDKLSLNSEPHHLHQIKRITTPNPFHLNTEERGAEKKQKFLVDVRKSRLEEERARIPRATPYPYTTDYPVIPPKPEPKQCTKPEPFQLESLVRHDEELQKKINERKKLDEEAAQMRLFQAQTILKDDPLPVSEKKRKALTQVKEFALYADN